MRRFWLLGAALLAAVVAAALHFSEERAFVRIAERAEPWWLAAALALQAGTYLAQGGVWRRVALQSGYTLARREAFELGLAKLFADQALPSGGLSSSLLVDRALAGRDLPPAVVKASVLINLASYYLAYTVALVVALVIVARRGQGNAIILVASALFLLFSLGVSGAIVVMAGRRRIADRFVRVPAVRSAVDYLAAADRGLVRSPRVLAGTAALQGVIILLDAATLWTLILALGARASAAGVFASFMVASLFRTMGIMPGGLGTFEATSVITLRWAGVDLAAALSATLLFRGLSFWIPMLPGYWCSRRVVSEGRRSSA
ncbi:MAG: flippase-like domain-containing protein [Acidobacteria bacterium]|nr:flippase-like domain-containing protein [Acidobacteriota bacterium]